MPREESKYSSREITSVEELQALEAEIGVRLSAFPVDAVLLAVREHGDRLLPFVAAGIASFALRFCKAASSDAAPVSWQHLTLIKGAVEDYLFSDPVVFDPTLKAESPEANLVLVMVRLSGSQLPYTANTFETFARSLLLFEEIPRELRGRPGIPGFDVEAKFRALARGIELSRFINLGFIADGLVQRPHGLTPQSLDVMRHRGVRLGPPAEVRAVLQQLSATPAEFREAYARTCESDRRFGMYEFNPLHIFPLIRPWGDQPFWSARGGRIIAPVPDLVGARVSLGIYHQLLTAYGTDFLQYFGHVFSEYSGRILRSAVNGTVLSEEEIRTGYPESRGRKAPDWVVVEGSTAILIECKATRFTRAALTTGSVEAVSDSLKQVRKGLKQLHHFREACCSGAPGLEVLHQCTEFLPVVLTLEPLYGANGRFLREHIDRALLAEGVEDLPWRVVSIQELELVERHVRGGIPLAETLSRTLTDEVLAEYRARSRRVGNEESFLYPYFRSLASRLGLPDLKDDPSAVYEY
jgi:hypothetical protein